MQHRFFKAYSSRKEIKKGERSSLSPLITTFCRKNLSLTSCSSAELVSVSIQPYKIQNEKLYLQSVQKVNQVPSKIAALILIRSKKEVLTEIQKLRIE